MKYKIGVDFTYIKENKVSGIRKYGEEIVEGLLKYSNEYEIVLFVYEHLKEIFKEKFPKCKIVTVKFLFRNIKYIRRINIYKISKIPKKVAIKREKCNLVIYPFSEKLTPIIKKQKKIVVIHDIIPLDTFENKKSIKYYKEKNNIINIMKKTKNILTISEYYKKRLIDLNNDFKGKITIIPNSVDKLRKSDKNVYEILKYNDPYILNINSFLKHKNQITLVKAFNIIKNQIPHKLVLVGRPELDSKTSMYNDILKYVNEHDLTDRVIILSYISDEERNALLYNADLFVTTSLQEGFGRTPVEAALCQIPVISTRETSLPEATMNEVFYYNDPIDDEELANKIIEVINNKPSKSRLENIAKKLQDEYSQENIIKKYDDIIKKIIN